MPNLTDDFDILDALALVDSGIGGAILAISAKSLNYTKKILDISNQNNSTNQETISLLKKQNKLLERIAERLDEFDKD